MIILKKICTRCNIEKPISEFYKKSGTDRVYSECKVCFGDRRMDAYREKQSKVSEYKTQRGCQKCGYNAHAVALDLHHTDSTEKENNVAAMARSNMSWSKIQAEMDKCIVLCAICHRLEHHMDI